MYGLHLILWMLNPITTLLLHLFYGCLDFVWDYPGELLLER